MKGLDETTMAVVGLTVIACWALSTMSSPEAVVTGVIGAIAGFVTGQAVRKGG